MLQGKFVDVSAAEEEVREEVKESYEKYMDFTSPHEGYALLLEEVDELWDEVKKKPDARGKKRMRGECKQIAAMAIRFMADLT